MIPLKEAYLERGCQLFAGTWQYKKTDTESGKKGWKWGVRTVSLILTSEWWNGVEDWTVGYWNGEVAISLRSDGRIPEWCLGMMFGNSGTMSGNGYTKYVFAGCVKMELPAGICRFVETVSVRVWFAQNSPNGIGMMSGFHRCCGTDNPVRLVVTDSW